jgi:hypothetical protein
MRNGEASMGVGGTEAGMVDAMDEGMGDDWWGGRFGESTSILNWVGEDWGELKLTSLFLATTPEGGGRSDSC